MGLNLGAVDYVAKPFHLPIVRARVRNHLQLKRQADLLEELAHVDSLTGIANRRRFDQTIAAELRRCQREKLQLSLMMIDIDHFKQFNDYYGHGLGDSCLIDVATALATHLGRASDLVARIGGEEFAVLVPGSDLEHATQMAERLRQAVASLNIEHRALGAEGRVSISIGVATHCPNGHFDAAAFIAEADNRLYAAKRAGRNRVEN